MSLLLKDEFRLPNELSTRIQWQKTNTKKNKARTKSWNNTNSDTNRKYQKAPGRESILCLKYNTCREGIIPKASYGRVWRYQKGNQNPYIEEEQTTQWPKEKVQKDKQRSTKHTYKTKDRVTRTPLKIGGELRCSGKVNSSCSTSDTRRVNLVTNPKSRMRKGPGIVYDKCNISVVICDTDIPYQQRLTMEYWNIWNYNLKLCIKLPCGFFLWELLVLPPTTLTEITEILLKVALITKPLNLHVGLTIHDDDHRISAAMN